MDALGGCLGCGLASGELDVQVVLSTPLFFNVLQKSTVSIGGFTIQIHHGVLLH